MKKSQILISALAFTFVCAVSAEGYTPYTSSMSSHQLQSLVVDASIGSNASSGGGAGVFAEGGKNASVSVTALSTGTSFGSTTVGLGKTYGDADTSGSDNTVSEPPNSTNSDGATSGAGRAVGITSTSVAGHTDNVSVNGKVNGKGSFEGGAVSYSTADAYNQINLNYKEVQAAQNCVARGGEGNCGVGLGLGGGNGTGNEGLPRPQNPGDEV